MKGFTKKLICLIMVIAMVMGLGVTAFAADDETAYVQFGTDSSAAAVGASDGSVYIKKGDNTGIKAGTITVYKGDKDATGSNTIVSSTATTRAATDGTETTGTFLIKTDDSTKTVIKKLTVEVAVLPGFTAGTIRARGSVHGSLPVEQNGLKAGVDVSGLSKDEIVYITCDFTANSATLNFTANPTGGTIAVTVTRPGVTGTLTARNGDQIYSTDTVSVTFTPKGGYSLGTTAATSTETGNAPTVTTKNEYKETAADKTSEPNHQNNAPAFSGGTLAASGYTTAVTVDKIQKDEVITLGATFIAATHPVTIKQNVTAGAVTADALGFTKASDTGYVSAGAADATIKIEPPEGFSVDTIKTFYQVYDATLNDGKGGFKEVAAADAIAGTVSGATYTVKFPTAAQTGEDGTGLVDADNNALTGDALAAAKKAAEVTPIRVEITYKAAKYEVTLDPATGKVDDGATPTPKDLGTFALSDSSEKASGTTAAGKTITAITSGTEVSYASPVYVHITPEAGQSLTKLSVVKTTDKTESTAVTRLSASVYMFYMPAHAITVSAEFGNAEQKITINEPTKQLSDGSTAGTGSIDNSVTSIGDIGYKVGDATITTAPTVSFVEGEEIEVKLAPSSSMTATGITVAYTYKSASYTAETTPAPTLDNGKLSISDVTGTAVTFKFTVPEGVKTITVDSTYVADADIAQSATAAAPFTVTAKNATGGDVYAFPLKEQASKTVKVVVVPKDGYALVTNSLSLDNNANHDSATVKSTPELVSGGGCYEVTVPYYLSYLYAEFVLSGDPTDSKATESTGTSTSGSGKLEGYVSTDVFIVTLPTFTSGDTTYDFIIDPNGLIAGTDAVNYSGADFEKDASVYFKNTKDGTASYSSKSDAVRVYNNGSTDIDIKVTAEVNFGTGVLPSEKATAITMAANTDSLKTATTPQLYLAINALEDVATVPSTKAITTAVDGKTVTVGTKTASYLYSDSTTVGLEWCGNDDAFRFVYKGGKYQYTEDESYTNTNSFVTSRLKGTSGNTGSGFPYYDFYVTGAASQGSGAWNDFVDGNNRGTISASLTMTWTVTSATSSNDKNTPTTVEKTVFKNATGGDKDYIEVGMKNLQNTDTVTLDLLLKTDGGPTSITSVGRHDAAQLASGETYRTTTYNNFTDTRATFDKDTQKLTLTSTWVAGVRGANGDSTRVWYGKVTFDNDEVLYLKLDPTVNN